MEPKLGMTPVALYGSPDDPDDDGGGGFAGKEAGVPHLAMVLWPCLLPDESGVGSLVICSTGLGGRGTFGEGWRGKTGCGRGWTIGCAGPRAGAGGCIRCGDPIEPLCEDVEL